MIDSYKCQSCEMVFPLAETIANQSTSFERCPNCEPISFLCSSCNLQKQITFERACNVCVQSDALVCSECEPSVVTICNGCLYPVCSKHCDILDAFSFKTKQKIFFHFCNGFEDPKMCFEAFRRLRTNDFEDEDVYYSTDWLTHTLSEPRVTRKWAARQHFSVANKK